MFLIVQGGTNDRYRSSFRVTVPVIYKRKGEDKYCLLLDKDNIQRETIEIKNGNNFLKKLILWGTELDSRLDFDSRI